MFNSIKKDKNRRHLVKKFEIQRLQNKVLLQAISGINDNFLENKKDMKSKTLVKGSSILSSTSKTSKTNFLLTLSKKIDDTSEQKIEPKYHTFEDTNTLFVNLKSLWQNKVLKFTPRNSSKSRVRNRCIETGRSRSVLRFCKLSRICLRDKASRGLLPGVRKASW